MHHYTIRITYNYYPGIQTLLPATPILLLCSTVTSILLLQKLTSQLNLVKICHDDVCKLG